MEGTELPLEGLIRRLIEARRADTQERKIGMSRVCNPLRSPIGDHYNVTRFDCLDCCPSDLYLAHSVCYHVPLDYSDQPMQLRRTIWHDAGASDRNGFVFQGIQQLEDEAPFLREELAGRVGSKYGWFQVASYAGTSSASRAS